MNRNFLNQQQKKWLYDHFSESDNVTLAEKLDDMVRKSNAIEKEKLEAALPNVTRPATRESILRDIKFIENFKGITPKYVVSAARRMKCKPKSKVLISDISRQKALITRRRFWRRNAQNIKELMGWFRTYRAREFRFLNINSESEIKKVRSAISTWNKNEGHQQGLELVSEVDRQILVMRIEAKLYKAV